MNNPRHIHINGFSLPTFLHKDGTETFMPDNLIRKLCIHKGIKVGDVHQLYELEAITEEDVLRYYAAMGFTVSGLLEMNLFEEAYVLSSDDEIERTVEVDWRSLPYHGQRVKWCLRGEKPFDVTWHEGTFSNEADRICVFRIDNGTTGSDSHYDWQVAVWRPLDSESDSHKINL